MKSFAVAVLCANLASTKELGALKATKQFYKKINGCKMDLNVKRLKNSKGMRLNIEYDPACAKKVVRHPVTNKPIYVEDRTGKATLQYDGSVII